MPLEKQLDSITEDDLQSLITDKVPEGKTIDYKVSLPENRHTPRRRFLANVSSLANAGGGHLIFGMREENGYPVELCGLEIADQEAEIQRLVNTIQNNIEPRIIPDVSMRSVPLQSSRVAIVIRIPHSWSQPHVVNYEGHWKFYSRNSTGKYPLDVSEVRAAFALSDTIAERTRLFRAERLGKIVSGETPIVLEDNAKIVLHIIPFGALNPVAQYASLSVGNGIWPLIPIFGSSANNRYNLDGILTYNERSYLQLFRNGIIETVDTYLLNSREGQSHIPSGTFEDEQIERLPGFLSYQEQLGVSPPLFIMLSLLRVSGYTLAVGHDLQSDAPLGVQAFSIDRDALVLPEVMTESFDVNPAEVLRPIFDALWNATGWSRSMNYDEQGQRTRQ